MGAHTQRSVGDKKAKSVDLKVRANRVKQRVKKGLVGGFNLEDVESFFKVSKSIYFSPIPLL